MRKKRRILVLMHEELVPPDSLRGVPRKEIDEFRTELDVIEGLEALGHDVLKLGVGSDLGPIRRAFVEHEPDIAFNLLVDFHEVAIYDQHVVGFLELLRKRYTGCNPRGLMLARDKGLSKELLGYHRIKVPRFAVFPVGKKARKPAKLPYPLVVKSLSEEASLGIAQASLVTNDEKLKERVEFMHETFDVDVIAEEYVEGRELYVGVVGNQRLHTFPIWEMRLDQLPEGVPRIATAKVKWDVNYQKKHNIVTQRAEDLSDKLQEEIARMCTRIYRVLRLTGYARMDLRLSPDGTVYALEANPNPHLQADEDLALSAKAEGVEYPELLQRIVNLGLNYRAAWDTESD
jgi:D-alanine-D-alanine ligase